MGHESLATTAIYVRVPLRMQSTAVNLLPDVQPAAARQRRIAVAPERTGERHTSRTPFRGHVIDQKIWMLGIASERMGDETGRSQPSELTSRHTAMDGELKPKDEISIEDASQVSGCP